MKSDPHMLFLHFLLGAFIGGLAGMGGAMIALIAALVYGCVMAIQRIIRHL